MKKDIILTPVKDYYELWDQKKYNSMISLSDSSSFEELAERVMGDNEETIHP
jgi:DNA-binding transcriptional regulator/RsmH inhibitor MraZ